MRLLRQWFIAKPHSSRNQYSVRPTKEKPMNPRTLNFFPPSFTVIEHLYTFPLSRSRISPPVHWPPSFVRSQTIRRPIRRRSLRSPAHRTQRGSGSFGSELINLSIFPYSLPFSSQISTTEFVFPVTSSTVFHRPTGVKVSELCGFPP